MELGQLDAALPLALAATARHPDDPDAAEQLRTVRETLRGRRRDELVDREFPELHTRVVAQTGDLFDHADANLVIGFCDTFDTATDDNVLISRDSVQGQLLHRYYSGDSKALDRELQRGLRLI